MKIALIINDNFTMWHFRRSLINSLIEKGIKVYTITPPGKYTEKIKSLGAVHITVPMSRFINPVNDILTVVRLYRIFRREKFDIVHNMQIKPTIYGTIASRLARVPRVTALLPGLGYPFFVENPGLFLKVLGRWILWLLRITCKLNDKIWFQNNDDLEFCVAAGIVPMSKSVLIRGSGVNLKEFSGDAVDNSKIGLLQKELELNSSIKIVTMIVARLIWSKGVKEFIEAAEMMMNRAPNVKFILVGPFEKNHPDAIPSNYLEGKNLPNLHMITEFREDVREIIWLSDLVVLPSYFREGVPRVLIEALSLGKPIVTTDHTGCREIVDVDKNGYLVPVKNPKALADAIAKLIEDESLRQRFGKHSRHKAESEFDEKIVVHRILTELYGIRS